MRPSKRWTKYIDEVWKLIKPAYGLVESGRLWQLCIEEWLSEYGFKQIAGFPQFFVLPSDGKIPGLFLVKVVDDILLAGETREIEKFSKAISKRFEVGRALIDIYLIFNKLLIK